VRKLVTNLTTWVLVAVVSGALVGHIFPERAILMAPLGKYFIELVKLFIFPLIFFTITIGVSSMSDLRRVGTVGVKAILYFEVVTTSALLIGVLVAYFIQPGAGVLPVGTGGDIRSYTERAQAFSWIDFLAQNATLQVLLFSLLFGSGLGYYKGKARVLGHLEWLMREVFRWLHRVMLLAPLGAFGGMAFTIGKYGLHTLAPLAKLMLTVYATMAVFIFGVLWWILRYYNVRIRSLLNYIKEELLIVLGTSSSEAALPPLMEKLEQMGCPKSVVGLVVPTGYSFNLDGTTIYLSMAVLFLAQVYAVDLQMNQYVTIIGILMVTSKGAAGVTGSGFVVLASTLSAIQVIPVEGLALLIGVDRFMSEARAITNFIGNAVATIVVSNWEGDFDRSKMEQAFSTEVYEYEQSNYL